MKEQEFQGSASAFRKSEFIDAEEDLAGRTKANPIETTVEAMVICNGVVNKDGKTEDGVFAGRLKGATRRLRMNATKRKIMTVAAGSPTVKTWAGLKVRLYQTWDSDRVTGGKTAVKAVALDCFDAKRGVWLDYFDFQQPKGQGHVRAAREAEARRPAPEATPPASDTGAPTAEELAAMEEGMR